MVALPVVYSSVEYSPSKFLAKKKRVKMIPTIAHAISAGTPPFSPIRKLQRNEASFDSPSPTLPHHPPTVMTEQARDSPAIIAPFHQPCDNVVTRTTVEMVAQLIAFLSQIA